MMFSVEAKKISKAFGAVSLFRKLSFKAVSGEVLAVTGWNGAGKSTLLRIIAGLERQSFGTMTYLYKDAPLDDSMLRHHMGMCAPSFSLYGELSGLENLEFLCRVRNIPFNKVHCEALLDEIGLGKAGHKLLATYSSGMHQRLKLVQAILHEPSLLLLDEPGSNLDEKGKAALTRIIKKQKKKGVTLIATNETWETDLSDRILNLSE